MPRYADIDAILSALPDDLPYKASVKRVLMQAPEADVVPRSEYDAVVSAVDNSTKEFLKLHDKYQDIKREAENYKSIAEYQQKLSIDRYFEIKQLKQELDRAKADVAREIFEELEKFVSVRIKVDGVIRYDIRDKFIKVKKKYTEGEK